MNIDEIMELCQDLQDSNPGVDMSEVDCVDSSGDTIKGVYFRYDHSTGDWFIEISSHAEEDLET